MNNLFKSNYAYSYDFLYFDKDYTKECDLIEELFNFYSQNKVKNILDLGCGTGNHAKLLVERNYNIVGIDKSKFMIKRAKNKFKYGVNKIQFFHQDLCDINFDIKFDCVLMMFSVLGYQLRNNDVIDALKIVTKHLKPDGLFIFDFWYGPAVLNLRPSNKKKEVLNGETKIIRYTTSKLDEVNHLCYVKFKIQMIKGSNIKKEFYENHTVRFFFPQELNLYLESAGLTLLKLSAFPDIESQPNENTWNCLGVAKLEG